MLTHLVESVQSRRNAWLTERRLNGSQRWYNPDDQPGAEYAAVLDMVPIAVPVLDQPVGQYRDAGLVGSGYTGPDYH